MLFYLISGISLAAIFLLLFRSLMNFSKTKWKRILIGAALVSVLILSLRINLLAPLVVGILQWGLLQFVNGFINNRVNSKNVTNDAGEKDLSKQEAADLLGVNIDAELQEIEAAYRRLQKKNHPDAGGSDALSALLSKARDILLDKK
jgi:hypothetical protein